MELFIGVEAVGMRNTAAVVSDRQGRLVAGKRIMGEPIALHTTPRDLFRSRLNQLFKSIAREIGSTLDELENCVVCLGLSGVNSRYDREVDLPGECNALGLRCKELICTGDAEIVLASQCQSLTGSGILSGMGSAAFVSGPSGFVRTGGWGPVIGDEGSGYSMGKAAVRAIGKEAELRETPSILWSEICRWLEGRSIDPSSELNEWIVASLKWRQYVDEHRRHHESCSETSEICDFRRAIFGFAHQLSLEGLWWFAAAGLVAPLMRAWDLGDARSSFIIENAVHDLANQHFQASTVYGDARVLEPVVLYGGVITHNPRFREALELALEKFYGRRLASISVSTPGTMRPAIGALLFALGHSTSQSLSLPSQEVLARLRDSYREQAESFNLLND